MPTFAKAVDNFKTTLRSSHSAGASTLLLQVGAGAALGTLAAGQIFRVVALQNPDTSSELVLAVLDCTGISTDDLTGVTASTGYTNVSLPSGTGIQVRMVALDATDLQSAVNTNTTAIATKGPAFTITAVKTANYTLAASEFVRVDTTSGAVTITLPTAPADGTRAGVKHVTQGGTNAVTIACGGSDVFNKSGGAASASLPLLSQGLTLLYRSSEAVWVVDADDIPLSQLDLRYASLASANAFVNTQTITSPSAAAVPARVKGFTLAATVSNVALTSNVATITTSAAHGFTSGATVVVAGLTNSGLNGTWTITGVTSTTFTFAKTATNISSVSDSGTATAAAQTGALLDLQDGLGNSLVTGSPAGIAFRSGLGVILYAPNNTTNTTLALDVNGFLNFNSSIRFNTSPSFAAPSITGNGFTITSTTNNSVSLVAAPNNSSESAAVTIGSSTTLTTSSILSLSNNGHIKILVSSSGGMAFRQQSSTTSDRDAGSIDAVLVVSTDASHTGRITLSAADFTSSHAGRREGVRVESDGTQALIGFFGATAVAKAASPGTASGTDATVINAVITILRNLGLCS